jgi:hypothetical protein
MFLALFQNTEQKWQSWNTVLEDWLVDKFSNAADNFRF